MIRIKWWWRIWIKIIFHTFRVSWKRIKSRNLVLHHARIIMLELRVVSVNIHQLEQQHQHHLNLSKLPNKIKTSSMYLNNWEILEKQRVCKTLVATIINNSYYLPCLLRHHFSVKNNSRVYKIKVVIRLITSLLLNLLLLLLLVLTLQLYNNDHKYNRNHFHIEVLMKHYLFLAELINLLNKSQDLSHKENSSRYCHHHCRILLLLNQQHLKIIIII